MDIRYDRDGNHNYLVMEMDSEIAENYEYKMLENNDIKGIIPFEIRRLNGCTYMYYEIDSKQSLKNRYSIRKLDHERLKSLLLSIANTSDRLSDFFLDGKNMVLSDECIFESISTGEFYFLYDPCGQEDTYISFPEMILSMVDMEDEKAAGIAYGLCDLLRGENVNLGKAIEELLHDEQAETEPEDTSCLTEIDSIREIVPEDDNDPEDEEENECETEHRIIKIRFPSKISILLSILFALVAGALWYIRVMYILTFEENIVDLVVLMVCVMMSLISLLQGTKEGRGKRKRLKREDDYVDDEDAQEKDEESYESPYVYESVPMRETDDEQDDDCEETVFFSFDKKTENRKLYSNNKDRSSNISLENLPISIGKKAELSDVIINEPSVSRLHARIFSKDGEMWVQDLNSRNGTYINGRKLLPNEKSVLIPEDEIAFGKCSFSYR